MIVGFLGGPLDGRIDRVEVGKSHLTIATREYDPITFGRQDFVRDCLELREIHGLTGKLYHRTEHAVRARQSADSQNELRTFDYWAERYYLDGELITLFLYGEGVYCDRDMRAIARHVRDTRRRWN